MAVYERGTVETAIVLLRELLKHPVINRESNSSLIMRIQQDSEVLNLWQEVLEQLPAAAALGQLHKKQRETERDRDRGAGAVRELQARQEQCAQRFNQL